jgi:hypothetical protein
MLSKSKKQDLRVGGFELKQRMSKERRREATSE